MTCKNCDNMVNKHRERVERNNEVHNKRVARVIVGHKAEVQQSFFKGFLVGVLLSFVLMLIAN